jgi:CRP/FNR family transcriptional regulator, cyclic AMP receptor protein
VRRGAIIFAKGDAGTELIAVLRGRVRISVPAPGGRKAVLNVVQAGEIFGEIALLDGRPRTADATAISDCDLMVIKRRDFVPFIYEQPGVAVKLIEILCARLRQTSEQVEDVMFLDLRMRLAKQLLRMVEQAEGPLPHRILVTQREISQMIGMSRESTNKQLRSWAQARWVRLERGGIVVLKPEALAEIQNEGQ